MRLLKYAGNSSKNLFFTTTLQNSVQSFSLKRSKLLDPSDTHPSPPSAFALSCDSHLLLSTSASPPTIHLRNMALKAPPILLRPRCSSSAVVAADFHPERSNIFLLAFADGTAVVYDAKHMFRDNGRGERKEKAAGSGTGGEIGVIKGLHATGTSTEGAAAEGGVCLDYAAGTGTVGVGPEACSITAVALVSGYKATAVTVGADGKCCVVDFTQPTKKKAMLLKTWHLRRPATSLSVIYTKWTLPTQQLDGANERRSVDLVPPANKDYCIAVGRRDGKVLLFDLDGKPLGEQVLDPKGARVVDVEWAKTEIEAAFAQRGSSPATSQAFKDVPDGKSLGTSVLNSDRAADGQVTIEADERSQNSLFDFSNPRKPIGALPRESPSDRASTTTFTHRDLKQAEIDNGAESNGDDRLKTPHRHSTGSDTTVRRKEALNQGVVFAAMESDTTPQSMPSSESSTNSGSAPPIPPRPTPKAGGRLSLRRAQTNGGNSPNKLDLGIIREARKASAGNPRFAKGLALKAPPSKSKALFGPRELPLLQAKNSRKHAILPGSPKASLEPENGSRSFVPEPPRIEISKHVEIGSTGHKPERTRSEPEVSPMSSTTSINSYKTASSQIYSTGPTETSSNDTVVDWSASSSRRPQPSLHLELPANQDPTRPERGKKKKKGHVSLSASSESEDTIIQWPSLKKSPRVPDLSQGIPEPMDSATAVVLERGRYMTASPEKPRPVPYGYIPASLERPVLVPGSYTASPPDMPAPLPGSDMAVSNERPAPGPYVPISTVNVPPDPHPCACTPHLQDTLRASLEVFRVEMMQQFEAQRMLLEQFVQRHDDERRGMEVENRILRDELAAMEKGTGKAKGKGKEKANWENGSHGLWGV